jgi:plasmid stabilization system protein ParE
MKAIILEAGEADLEQAFNYYETRQQGLGDELLVEFRQGVDRILEFPLAWQKLDRVYRRYRLHRFPYGLIYRIDRSNEQIVIVAVMHLSRRPGNWRNR